MEKRTLPQDLRRYVIKRVLIRILACAVLLAAFLTILIVFDSAIFDPKGNYLMQNKTLFYTAAILLPFVLTGVPVKLIDSTWEGEITKIMVRSADDNLTAVRPEWEQNNAKNTITLVLNDPEGKLLCKKVADTKATADKRLDAYAVGDHVFHLYGSKHTVVLPEKATDEVSCVVCGTANSHEANTCSACGHSLIR